MQEILRTFYFQGRSDDGSSSDTGPPPDHGHTPFRSSQQNLYQYVSVRTDSNASSLSKPRLGSRAKSSLTSAFSSLAIKGTPSRPRPRTLEKLKVQIHTAPKSLSSPSRSQVVTISGPPGSKVDTKSKMPKSKVSKTPRSEVDTMSETPDTAPELKPQVSIIAELKPRTDKELEPKPKAVTISKPVDIETMLSTVIVTTPTTSDMRPAQEAEPSTSGEGDSAAINQLGIDPHTKAQSSTMLKPMYRDTEEPWTSTDTDEPKTSGTDSEATVTSGSRPGSSVQPDSESERWSEQGPEPVSRLASMAPEQGPRPASVEPEQGPRPASVEPEQGPRSALVEPEQGPRPAPVEHEQEPRPASAKPEQGFKPPSVEPEQGPRPAPVEPEQISSPPGLDISVSLQISDAGLDSQDIGHESHA